ncbi:SARP family transcriptional regulator [Saccharothrix sp. NRRL B-16348]|uniref:AfsR/SARP family transcriptional regulator n=1 Tax=Saccharothrix sp. NRRL B-16348 TaxID=1415542 RepID=UPI0006ADD4CE|nr:BTAD domain-containing putative transcriptional regulator [Saccharothrix sp. NRRL B-16348]KOX15310.1 SARP family transcriptional regulator [Saccharothrix sp. NRRL B-16348]
MLGPLEAWHGSARLPLGDQQQRFVLVVLLLHANRPVSTEKLTEIVWGGNPERRVLVRGYINKLRKAFQDVDDVSIETTPTGYLLRVDEDQVDTARFARLRAEAASAADAGDRRRAIGLLRAAVDLWRGRFLEDIDHDRIGGTEVMYPDDGFFDAVGDLAELELDAGDHRSARDRLRPVVRTDPARQKHAELLMRALIAGGDRVEAVRVFHGTEAALAELDMEPGPRLRKLAARAGRGEPASSLPSRPGGFTGRDAELAAIEAVASTPGERRAVWVSGAPGVGKTGLAVEAAHRLRDRFPDGQLLVRLNGYTPNLAPVTVSDALTQLLVELGVPPEQIPASVNRKFTLYQTELYGTRTLVVLDNAHSPEQVRSLLPEASGCLAVVTSRRMGEPDTGEHVRLPPLPPEDAFALFRALAGTLRLRGRSAEVSGVVKRCGYLPMPIRVAAALFRRHERWPLEHLLRQLEESGPWRADTDDEEGTAAVRVSYLQLDVPQREVFRLLGHLPGPDLDVVGAAALAGRDVPGVRAVLDDLHEVCLLEEVAPERYRMLDPLKEFAAAEPPPTTPTEHADALLRLLDFYLVGLADAVGAAYPFDRAQLPAVHRTSRVVPVFEDKDDATAWIAAELDNLVAAVRYAADHDLPGHVWRLAVLIWRHFNTTNRFEDWVETMELAYGVVCAEPDEHYGRAHVLLRLATAYDRLGRLEEALGLATRALAEWRRFGDVLGEAVTLCAIAVPLMELGRHDDAIEHFEAALEKYERCGDRRGQAHALSMLGYLNEERGNLDLALRQHLAAVPMLREVDHVQGLAHALNNLGTVQQRLGLADEALASHLEAYELACALGDDCLAAYALNYTGNVHRSQGRTAEAARYQERAKEVAAEVSDADLRTRLYLDRAATARDGGDRSEALRSYRAALDLAVGTGSRGHEAHAHHGVARALHALGQHATAAEHWRAAEAGFVALGQPEAAVVRAEHAALTCACR